MKKALVTTILGVLLLVGLSSSFGAFTNEQDKFILRVGYQEGYGVSKDQYGNLHGYIYEYMEEIADINNWNLQFIECTWSEGVELLEKGQVDLFGPMQKTPEGELRYDFPSVNMGHEYGALYVREDKNDIFYNDLKSIDQKTVGTTTNSYFIEPLMRYCKENNIYVNIKETADSDELVEDLENGVTDMLLSGSILDIPEAKVALRFTSEEFYFPTTKGNTYVLRSVNAALAQINRENVYYNAELYQKYYRKTAVSNEAFTQSENNFISTAPVLRIGYEINRGCLGYYDNETEEIRGIERDLLQNIFQYCGLKFEFVLVENFIQAAEMVKMGELDLIAGASNHTELASAHKLTLTEPVLDYSLVFIGKPNESEIQTEGRILAIPENWVGVQYHMAKSYPKMQIKTYASVKKCLDAVLSGEASLSVHNSYVVDAALKDLKYESLSIITMKNGHCSFAIALSPLRTDAMTLSSALNKGIYAIDEVALNQAIFDNTVDFPYTPSFGTMVRYNAYWLGGVVALFLILVLILSARSKRKLNKIAYYDEITGEMNLNKFKLEAQKLMNNKANTYMVAVIDINKFKSINDLYGYDFGDKMLRFVAQKLHTDILPDALLCRGTADKFYIMERFLGEHEFAEKFHLFAKSAESIAYNDLLTCKIVFNCGVYIIESENVHVTSIIDRANIACKSVKSSHTSSYSMYTQSMYDKINNAKEIENTMAYALHNHEFVVYLQPKFELITEKLIGAEALVRWANLEKGIIPPIDFIPLFEENGFIVDLDFYVFENVCKLLDRWKKEGKRLFKISVNLSRRHLQNINTADVLHKIIGEYDVSPTLIELELTESTFVDCNINVIISMLDQLHNYGFTVSVDDFGAGYSSLSLLKEIPIDVLKIDKSFFDGKDNYKTEILLESVISMSRKMNIVTVSEGVETKQQADLLRLLGCDIAQGYWFEKPLPIAQIEEKYQHIF